MQTETEKRVEMTQLLVAVQRGGETTGDTTLRGLRALRLLDRINEKAVQLRDEIGTGSAVAELRARVQNIVELSRTHLYD